MKILIITIMVAISLWVVYGYVSSNVKEPKYTIVAKKNGYEIREYAPYIEARVVVSGTYREAMSGGFRVLAGYIFGGNTKKQSIAMTAPVLEQKSEAVAMTAPVSETVLPDNSRVVSFVMPEEYTLETLPIPNDARVKLVEVPAHKTAVLRYSGYNNAEKVDDMKTKLLTLLKQDNIVVLGLPRGAGYNPPWTPPFMMRNEVLVDVGI